MQDFMEERSKLYNYPFGKICVSYKQSLGLCRKNRLLDPKISHFVGLGSLFFRIDPKVVQNWSKTRLIRVFLGLTERKICIDPICRERYMR